MGGHMCSWTVGLSGLILVLLVWGITKIRANDKRMTMLLALLETRKRITSVIVTDDVHKENTMLGKTSEEILKDALDARDYIHAKRRDAASILAGLPGEPTDDVPGPLTDDGVPLRSVLKRAAQIIGGEAGPYSQVINGVYNAIDEAACDVPDSLVSQLLDV